ncbi:aspartate/glutamate racemase family protein [Piscinibacter sakaiensis]|uniref:aspartate/glutamate racemase family protein n=1 Tax=Piscinibacter sakaiensis TaxID=1547922 RepID=UPI003AAB3B31
MPGDLERDGHLTGAMSERIRRLAEHAVHAGAQGVLFTCSAFGEAIASAACAMVVPVMRPEEAMFQAAMRSGQRIGLLATFEPAVAPMTRDFLAEAAACGLYPSVDVVCVPAAITAARAGDVATHNRLLAEAAPRLAHCDAVMLAHFSTSTALEDVKAVLNCPVFSSPDAAVDAMRSRLHLADAAT